nr:hypothetical protein KK1_018567 [Ipomoea batatas]
MVTSIESGVPLETNIHILHNRLRKRVTESKSAAAKRHAKRNTVSSSHRTNHRAPSFPSLNASTTARDILIACFSGCLSYALYLDVSSDTLNGGEDAAHRPRPGGPSKNTYPRVVFGLHHDSAYHFLLFHVFTELVIPNTTWLRFVAAGRLRTLEDNGVIFWSCGGAVVQPMISGGAVILTFAATIEFDLSSQ